MAAARPKVSAIPLAFDGVAGPEVGQRVMVLGQPWLELILSGLKTMEVRGSKCQLGMVWLGYAGLIHGRVVISSAAVLDEDEFRAALPLHRWPEDKPLPYKRCWGLMLAELVVLPEPVPYWRPGGAVGWNIFRRTSQDVVPKASLNCKRPPYGQKRRAPREARIATPPAAAPGKRKGSRRNANVLRQGDEQKVDGGFLKDMLLR